MFGVNLVHGVHVHIFVTMEQDQEKGIVHIPNSFTVGRNVQENLKKLKNVILIHAKPKSVSVKYSDKVRYFKVNPHTMMKRK